MSDHDTLRPSVPLSRFPIARWRDHALLAACRAATRHVDRGRLRLTLPSGQTGLIGEADPAPGMPDASLALVNFRVFPNALLRGSIGFADAYMAGDLRTPDLGALFRFFLANKARLDRVWGGQFKVRRGDRIWHRQRDNTRDGAKRNIAAHYDLGNDFYAAWLDASMTYSSALFSFPGQSLEDAQRDKLERIVATLDVRPGMRVLEIGCGWGALAETLARRGCHVTALTVSRAQAEAAQARILAAGLTDRVDIRFCDYRDCTGSFDRIVSVEMIEAVGEAHWPAYFETLAARLSPGGQIVLQAITMDPEAFKAYRLRPDFIQRYIFPGGMLLTDATISASARSSGLEATHLLAFAKSYAETLRHWRDRFEAAWPRLEAMGFDARFRRMWIYYLTYCEIGFETGRTDVGLWRLRKP